MEFIKKERILENWIIGLLEVCWIILRNATNFIDEKLLWI